MRRPGSHPRWLESPAFLRLTEGFEETKDVWYFPDAMIRHEFRARAGDLRIITIDGDSMEPVLSSGDRIMVDTSQRMPVPPGIFVIWDGMGIVANGSSTS